MFRIISYSVPYSKEINSGPISRVTAINQAIADIDESYIIYGPALKKFQRTLSAGKTRLLYVESSTNRVALTDLICLAFLRLKSEKMIVYIRDVYIEAFPEKYNTVRGRMTRFFNRLTYALYVKLADILAFPTNEMARVFYGKAGRPRRTTLTLPPACAEHSGERSHNSVDCGGGNTKILYLGGINYEFSGVSNFIDLIAKSPANYRFFIVTQDIEIERYLCELSDGGRDRVTVLAMGKDSVAEFINREGVHYLFHSRPLNFYDGLTFPIKIFDALEWNLPVLTARHPPLLELLGENYPCYVDVADPRAICELIEGNKGIYMEVRKLLKEVAERNTYQQRVQALLDCAEK